MPSWRKPSRRRLEPDPKALRGQIINSKRTAFETYNGRSALASGTAVYAPYLPFWITLGTGPAGLKDDIRPRLRVFMAGARFSVFGNWHRGGVARCTHLASPIAASARARQAARHEATTETGRSFALRGRAGATVGSSHRRRELSSRLRTLYLATLQVRSHRFPR
jgi:hypothetical protein